jgi:hypothetical protein
MQIADFYQVGHCQGFFRKSVIVEQKAECLPRRVISRPWAEAIA